MMSPASSIAGERAAARERALAGRPRRRARPRGSGPWRRRGPTERSCPSVTQPRGSPAVQACRAAARSPAPGRAATPWPRAVRSASSWQPAPTFPSQALAKQLDGLGRVARDAGAVAHALALAQAAARLAAAQAFVNSSSASFGSARQPLASLQRQREPDAGRSSRRRRSSCARAPPPSSHVTRHAATVAQHRRQPPAARRVAARAAACRRAPRPWLRPSASASLRRTSPRAGRRRRRCPPSQARPTELGRAPEVLLDLAAVDVHRGELGAGRRHAAVAGLLVEHGTRCATSRLTPSPARCAAA